MYVHYFLYLRQQTTSTAHKISITALSKPTFEEQLILNLLTTSTHKQTRLWFDCGSPRATALCFFYQQENMQLLPIDKTPMWL